MASPERCRRILSGVREEVDRFLDPSSLFPDHLASPVKRQSPAKLESPAKRDKVEGSDAVRLLDLRGELADVRTELEEAKEEAHRQRRRAESQKGREAGSVARLEQKCQHLEIERSKALEKAAEAERKLLEAEAKHGELLLECGEIKGGALRREEKLQRRLDEVSKRIEEASVASLVTEGSSKHAEVAIEGGGATEAVDGEAKALCSRIAELEGEVRGLQVLLKEGAPDRELSAQLQSRHAIYEEELKGAQRVRRELAEAREQLLRLEQENTSLKAAVDGSNTALEKAEQAAHSAGSKHDLEAFASAAHAIVAESLQLQGGDGSAGDDVANSAMPAVVTPLELSLAWVRLQTEVSALRRNCAKARQEVDSTSQQERSAQLELGKARNELTVLRNSVEELQLDLRREKDEAAAQRARAQVLREAITKAVGGEADATAAASMAAGADIELLKSQLEVVREHVRQQERMLQGRQEEMQSAGKELAAVQKDRAQTAELEAKVLQLERLNGELWTSNRELEQQQERLMAEMEQRDAQMSDFDPSTTKILHLTRGPDGKLATGSRGGQQESTEQLQALRAENESLREQLGGKANLGGQLSGVAPGDLERRQAERQLDRFKKATRKYVQEFREGIYGLLGWKVEMKGEGSAMRWHLTSRHHDEELVFQLRPGEQGRGAEFDLLATEWAERLQEDRQAMAYLEVYGSIPGFLAAVTTELLAQKTL